MGHKLESPLVRRCCDLTARLGKGPADGQYAAATVIKEAKAIAEAMEPKWRQEYLSDAAEQIEAAGKARTDDEVFILVAEWLRKEAASGPS